MHLEPYVNPSQNWGQWYLSRGHHPAALYNVGNGYKEFGLDDLTNLEMLVERVREMVEKTWCDGRETEDLVWALHDVLGVVLEVVHERSVEGSDQLPGILDRPRPRVSVVGFSRISMLSRLATKLRRGRVPRGVSAL